MEQAPGAKAWAHRPRVTVACGECKRRKVKCTETRPICKTCSSTGRKCVWPQDINSKRPVSARTSLMGHVQASDTIRIEYLCRSTTERRDERIQRRDSLQQSWHGSRPASQPLEPAWIRLQLVGNVP